MKFFIKKLSFIKTIITGICASAMLLLPFKVNAGVLTGQILDNGTMRNTILMTTNRGSAYSIEITATANSLINFYDIGATNPPYYGTNYVNAIYVSRSTAPTTNVYSFVGYNGYTNWYTNVGIFTTTITNAANTNALNPIFSAVVAGNTYATYSVDALFVQGLAAVAVAGTNINIVVNYRNGQ